MVKFKYKIRQILNKFFFGQWLKIRTFCNKRCLITENTDYGPMTYKLYSALGSGLYYGDGFEKFELEYCKKIISNSSVILDAGANIGIHSRFFANLSDDNLIISFEPNKKTYQILLDNVKDKKNILPLNLGLFRKNEIMTFFETDDDAFSGLKDTGRTKVINKSTILCVKLDDILKDVVHHVDFVKIDVEGLEYDVLEGMSDIIDKWHPTIFCEIFKGTNSNLYPEKTIDYLQQKGYGVFVFKDGAVEKYTTHDDNYYNYFFIYSR